MICSQYLCLTSACLHLNLEPREDLMNRHHAGRLPPPLQLIYIHRDTGRGV